MTPIRIPAAFHEVLGTESTVVELLLILVTSIGTTIALISTTTSEWAPLAGWQIVVTFLLIFDIFAGFVANLTFSTNNYYQVSLNRRLIFIAIHVQPLIFSFFFEGHLLTCVLVWGYTIISALFVNALQTYPAQKAVAGTLAAIGLVGLLLNAADLPLILLITLAFYQLKVIYSFAVHQYATRYSAKGN